MPKPPSVPDTPAKSVEALFERMLFASRWFMAPMYLCLVIALAMLTVIFVRDTVRNVPRVLEMSADDGIMGVLSLIDVTLAANLVLIVIFAGYENFVSKLDLADDKDRPSWMGKVDYADLKMKLVASIIAISGIHLLQVFMELGHPSEYVVPVDTLRNLVIVHLTFVVSGVLLALMYWLNSRTTPH